MIDLRLWRAALLGVGLALIVAMFSLEEVPEPLASDLPPDAFDADAATTLARELATSSPEPEPGGEQDAAVADLVESRFTAIPSAIVSEQRFDAEVDGDAVELRNLILVIPGQSDRQVALIAHRDAEGEGAGSALAATAALLEIANGFAGSPHRKSLVFVSTDGGSAGALGARRFIEDYSDADQLEAAVVLSQPAAPEPEPPLVIPWSSGPESTAAQLVGTATQIVSEQADMPVGDESPLEDVARLALPSALGEQGPLIEAGFDAVRISSSGELPPPPGGADATEVEGETMDRFGRSAMALMLALDAARDAPQQGPQPYIGLAGNLLPGWTLGLLALALLAPVLAVGFAGAARAAHSPAEAIAALGWTLLRAVPFVCALLLVHLLAFLGLIPSPAFPFDPGAESLGRGGAIGVGLVVLLGAGTAFLLRPLLPPPATFAAVAPSAVLSVAALAGFAVWWVNPYLGLLAGVGLQAWVLAAGGVGRTRLGAAGLVAAGFLPSLLIVVTLASRFDAGPGVVWDLLLMLTGGQLSDRLALILCVLVGSALALIAALGPPAAPGTPQLKLGALVARGRALEQRRAARRGRSSRGRRRGDRGPRGRRRGRPRTPRPRPEAGEAPEPESPPPTKGEPAGGEPEPGAGGPPPEPGEPQPERAPDPRMWSKPARSILRPSGVLTAPASAALTSPISVRR